MSAQREHDPGDWARLKRPVREFNEAWGRQPPPDIETHLERVAAADRPALLVHLVHIDLERRLKAGEAARVNNYLKLLEAYPPADGKDEVVLGWIEAEYKLRRKRGEPGLTPRVYLEDFPNLADRIAQRLTLPVPPPSPPSLRCYSCCCPHCKADPLGLLLAAGPPREVKCQKCGQALDYVDRYVKLRELGRGSFGTVYHAYDLSLNRSVALKVAHAGGVSSERVQSFLQEARSAARLDHPHIVRVHDTDVVEGQCLIAYQLIQGRSLRQRLQEGPLPWRQAAEPLASIADALQYAHEARLVHRDVKPENILLGNKGGPYLTDFGLAVAQEQLLQQRGMVAGTLAYMAPEQVRGESHRVGPWTDVYGLGVVLYEVLSGELPFKAEEQNALCEQIKQQEPWLPSLRESDVPPELGRICLKALSKKKEDRQASAGELAHELRACCAATAGEQLAAGPEFLTAGVADVRQRDTPLTPMWKRGRFLVAVAACTACFLALVAVFVIRPILDPVTRRDSPDVRLEWLALGIDGPIRPDMGRRQKREETIYLVSEGSEQENPGIEPVHLVGGDEKQCDRIQIVGQFNRPTTWWLVWIDTNGEAALLEQSDQNRKEIHAPSKKVVVEGQEKVPAFVLGRSEPAGTHLLLLLISPSSRDRGDELLQLMSSLGRPVKDAATVHPGRGVFFSRGQPEIVEAIRERSPEDHYLARIVERLPAHVKLQTAIYFETKK